MTREEFFERLEKLPRGDYIVRMAAWYDWEPKPRQGQLFNEILQYNGNDDCYEWLNDWDEGQQNVQIIGFCLVEEVSVPVCDDYLSTFG